MSRPHAKLVIAGSILTVAVAYLAYAGVQAGRSYYLEVDKFLGDPQLRQSRARVHGIIAREDLIVAGTGGRTSFLLLGETGRLPVVFDGVVPDLFQAARRVVVEGRLNADGVFVADQVLAKCASKYDRREPPAGEQP